MPKSKTRFRVIEIISPATEWQKSGTYVPCPSQWADRDKPIKVIITLPDGTEMKETVRSTVAGAGYIPVSRELVGKVLTIRTISKRFNK